MTLGAIVQVLLWIVPWKLRRVALQTFFGFSLHETSSIGFSVILVRSCVLGSGSRIGSGTIVKGLDLIELGEGGRLGNFNWVTGYPSGRSDGYFLDHPHRRPMLKIGDYSSITSSHVVDCTDAVTIGSFSVVGGWRSQLLTHSLQLSSGRQTCAPIEIGHHCFVGTGVVVLKGSKLGNRSVLTAGSVLSGIHEAELSLLCGNPAKVVKALDENAVYFIRDRNHEDD